MKRSIKLLILGLIFLNAPNAIYSQVDSLINRDFLVIFRVGDVDTVGVLELNKAGAYEFKSLNNVNYEFDTLSPIFLAKHKGKYKIKEVGAGSFIINFCPDCSDEKNKSFKKKNSCELGIACREEVCGINFLASTLDGWHIVSMKKKE